MTFSPSKMSCRWVPDSIQGGSWLWALVTTSTFGTDRPDVLGPADSVVVATGWSGGSPLVPSKDFAAGTALVLWGWTVGEPYEGTAHVFRPRPPDGNQVHVVDPWRVGVRWGGMDRVPVAELGEIAEALRLSASRGRPVVTEAALPVTANGVVDEVRLEQLGVQRTIRHTRGAGRKPRQGDLLASAVARAAAVLGGTADGDAVLVHGRRVPVAFTAGSGHAGNVTVTELVDEIAVVWDFDGRADTGTVELRRVVDATPIAWQAKWHAGAPDDLT
jgi:hypothetical protein